GESLASGSPRGGPVWSVRTRNRARSRTMSRSRVSQLAFGWVGMAVCIGGIGCGLHITLGDPPPASNQNSATAGPGGAGGTQGNVQLTGGQVLPPPILAPGQGSLPPTIRPGMPYAPGMAPGMPGMAGMPPGMQPNGMQPNGLHPVPGGGQGEVDP